MKRPLTSYLLGGAMALCALAAPGFASETLTLAFTDSAYGGATPPTKTTGGAFVVSGSTVTSMHYIPFTTLTVSNGGTVVGTFSLVGSGAYDHTVTGDTATSGALLNMSGATLSLLGGIVTSNPAFSNLSGGGNTLVSFQGDLTPTLLAGGTIANVGIGSATGINVSTLLSDLGFSYAPISIGVSSGSGVLGQSTPNSTFGSYSNSLTVSAVMATPEPATFLILGTGLIAIARLARRYSAPSK